MESKQKLVLVSAILLLLSAFSVASVNLSPDKANSSPVNPAYFQIFLNSDEDANYSVDVESPGETVVAPEAGKIGEDENRTVNLWFRPLRDLQQGQYRLEVKVLIGTTEKVLRPLVYVENSHRIEIIDYSIPECGREYISVEVSNKGYYNENIRFEIDGENKLQKELGPGKKIKLNISFEGNLGRLTVDSANSYARDSINFDLNCGNRNKQILAGQFFSSPTGVAGVLAVLILALAAVLQYSGRIDLAAYLSR